MEVFRNLMYIFVTSSLVENIVLAKFLGCCPFLGVSKKLDSAVGMSSAVIFVLLMSTAVTWPIYTFLLVPFGLEYLQTIVFILVIAALVQLVEFVMKKYMKPLYRALGVYLPLITTNCAVLGCVLLNVENSYNFIESIVNTLGIGIGFMLAMVLFAGVRRKMETVEFPKSFQGVPITLVAASIVSTLSRGITSVKVSPSVSRVKYRQEDEYSVAMCATPRQLTVEKSRGRGGK